LTTHTQNTYNKSTSGKSLYYGVIHIGRNKVHITRL